MKTNLLVFSTASMLVLGGCSGSASLGGGSNAVSGGSTAMSGGANSVGGQPAALGGRTNIGGQSVNGTGGTTSGSTLTGGTPAATGGMPAATGGMPAATGGMAAATGGMAAATGGMPAASGGVPAATGGVSAATGGSGTGTQCGSAICGTSEYCCNASCSICAPLNGGGCIQMVCTGTGGSSSTGGASGTGGSSSITGLHSACVNGACASSLLTPVTYYGIAGTAGPEFCSCEIPCSTTACPTNMKCISIADGPSSICAFTDSSGNTIWP